METDPPGSLPAAVVDELLADERRRRLLSRLAAADGPVLIEQLAPVVLEGDGDREPRELSADRRREAREQLFERHLPALTATRVVEYDPTTNAVELLNDELATRLR